MAKRAVNPWTWQDAIGFSQGVVVPGAGRTLYLAGQVACDGEGVPLCVGDMAGQTRKALENIATVLQQAGFALQDIVRLNIYTTDVEQFHRHGSPLIKQVLAGIPHASTLLDVARLASPDFLIELEATAVAAAA